MTAERSARITLIPERPKIAAGRDSQLDLLITIEAPEPAGLLRRPINLGLVLDHSGSMLGSKLLRARQAMAFAVNNMAPEDRVSLVGYNRHVKTLVSGGCISEIAPRIIAALNQVRASDSTALHDGWVRGGLEVSAALDPAGVNRVLLVSDGLANVGETSTEVIVSRAAELFARGVSTSTVGVGVDFNEDLMIPMAVSGGGAGWFVETPDDFRRIFEAELNGLFTLFGERGVLRLEPRAPGLSIELLNDFPRTEEGWAIGSLSHGSPLEIVARIKARGAEIGRMVDLVDVTFGIDAIGTGRMKQSRLFSMSCEDAAAVNTLPRSQEVRRVVALLMAARARVEAISRLDEGDYGTAKLVLDDALSSLRCSFGTVVDEVSEQEEDQLEALSSMLEEGDPTSVKLARKQAAYQSYSRGSGSAAGRSSQAGPRRPELVKRGR